MDFILDINPCNDTNEIKEVRRLARDYFSDLIPKKQYVGFIGFIDEKPVCGAGLLIYRLPPLFHPIIPTQGHVLNFFTAT